MRELYDRSRIVILPLINSFQPSGQSVTLQSLSMGLPTLITKTKGFGTTKNSKIMKYYFLENNKLVMEE